IRNDRLGGRHVEHRGRSAGGRTLASAFKILFVGHSRVSEVDVGIDESGYHRQACSVYHHRRAGELFATRSNLGYLSVGDKNISGPDTILGDYSSVSYHKVEGGHASS